MGNLFSNKTKAEDDLAKAKLDCISISFSLLAKDKAKERLEALNRILRMEESFCLQKSWIRWLKEGDNNTKFFHMSIVMRRNHNKILKIVVPDGYPIEDIEAIRGEGKCFFQSMLDSTNDVHIEAQTRCLANIPNLPSEEMNVMLMAPFSKEEIKIVAFSLGALKAPGPNGFHVGFFYKF
ncbi:hypothetical protein SUGI_0598180 [Cryptomeria japonica]|nr:hypothetical protein SUGI_0598180 [Cryptomeria japonica]